MPYRVDFAPADQDALLRLCELGALDAQLEANGHGAALLPDRVTTAEVADALRDAEMRVSAAAGRDDGSVWMLAPRPVRIGRLRLVPVAIASAGVEAGDLQMIDTPAFGTGLHPTTVLCVELLGEHLEASPVRAVLDVGTGSGVIALAALALGVPRVTALDLDREAVRATRENGRRNGFGARLHTVQAGPESVAARWPLVMANILAAPLIEMAPLLASRVSHGGLLVLSGIPSAMQADVGRAYRRVGMHLGEVRFREGWAAIVLRASW